MTTPAGGYDVSTLTRTSGPIDLNAPYPTSTLANKTIVITGAASGIGAGFARHWASHGANIVVADISVPQGEALVSSLPGPGRHSFFRCDVTVWEDQVRLFRAAAKASPTGGIDAVVANAGIPERNVAMSGNGFEDPPKGLDGEGEEEGEGDVPPAPRLDVLRTNLIGVMYTAQLALYWLPRNGDEGRDRTLLLIGSIAGITPLPGQPEYCTAKHAITGLWRALSGSCGGRYGIRVNLLLPYFVDTPLVPWKGMMFLAGGGWAEVPDVVDAGTRLVADEGIWGRTLAVSAPVEVRGEGDAVEVAVGGGGRRQAVWEVMAMDHEHVEVFVWRFIRLMNAIVGIRGWVGWLGDVVKFVWFRRRDEARKAAAKAMERKMA
jgi:NAD(P)-dependent dehydrogenase (short-subunit alcohol dehydrogenase family)